MPTQADYNEVAICNLALTEVGRSSLITSMDEDSTSARACKVRYPFARDAVLRAYDWNFAAMRVSLPKLANAPLFEFSAAYELPADCVQVRSVFGDEGCMWKVEGRILLSNTGPPLPVKYTRRVVDPTLFDPLFVTALASRIAADICIALSESTSRKELIEKVYQARIMEARRRDAQEDQPDQFPEGSWIDARYY